MDTWKHCLLSQKKFGGQPEDYLPIHKFLDSSKLFYFHLKHRSLLHSTYGIEICSDLFGDFMRNADGTTVMVRDIAAAHCAEDLNGRIPSLAEWFQGQDALADLLPDIPTYENDKVNEFIWLPYLRSGNKATLAITCSNFGVSLMQKFFDVKTCMQHAETLSGRYDVSRYLEPFQLNESWQHSPSREDLALLKQIAQTHEQPIAAAVPPLPKIPAKEVIN
ncbi:MAG: hypothetical protein AAF135_15520 [Bacteroidota bacterium]